MDTEKIFKELYQENQSLMFSDSGDKKPQQDKDSQQKVPPGFEKFLKRKNKEVPEEKKEEKKETAKEE